MKNFWLIKIHNKLYAYIYRFNTKIRLTMLCLSGLNYILIGCPWPFCPLLKFHFGCLKFQSLWDTTLEFLQGSSFCWGVVWIFSGTIHWLKVPHLHVAWGNTVSFSQECSLSSIVFRVSLLPRLWECGCLTCRRVASIYAHSPMRTAKIWKRNILYFYFLKAFFSLDRDDW